MQKTVMEQRVIWGYSKQIVKLPTCPGAQLCPRLTAPSRQPYFTAVPLAWALGAQGFRARPVEKAEASGGRGCLRSAPQGAKPARSRVQGGGDPARGPRLAALLAVRTEPFHAQLATARAGAETQPPPETAPTGRLQPPTSYLPSRSAAAETTPRGTSAQARGSNALAPLPRRRGASPFRKPASGS